MYRKVTCFTTPLEAKGLGGFNIRYYNDAEKYDEGFFYHPAFKKTGRSNATTWMNNTGGTDFTYGDGFGLQDPLVDWSFSSKGVQYKFLTEFVSPGPLIDENQRPVKEMQYDVGEKFPRMGYAVVPVHVVEGIPKIRHVYGKKMFYIFTFRYNKPEAYIPMMDAYDRQMTLWKHYAAFGGEYNKEGHYACSKGSAMWDLQSRHSTTYWVDKPMNTGLTPKDCSLKSLLAKGR
jgi:hypothetical protein